MQAVEAVTWVIAGILAVDLVIIFCLVAVEFLSRHRVQREIEDLDAIWNSPATRAVQAGYQVGALRVRTTRAAPRSAPARRLGAFSLGTAILAVASLVVVAILGGGPAPTRSLTFPIGSPDVAPREAKTPESAREAPPRADAQSFEERLLDAGAPPSSPSITVPGPGSVERIAAVPSSSSSIVLVWDQVAAAIRYDIERNSSSDSAPDWTLIAKIIDPRLTTFTDSSLEPETTYYYRVTAVTEAGLAPSSEVISATTLVPPPQATSLVVAGTSTTTIALDWADVEDETGYRIERSLGGDSSWATIATTGADITEHLDPGLAPNTTYRYRVVAMNEGGESPPSDV
jgi:hypothetical protein